MESSSSRLWSPRGDTLIVGREREQATLRQALDAMLAGQGSLVLVSGEAGIGKTTLVEWLAGEAEHDGCLVLRGGCYDLTTTPPYGPWVEALEGYAGDQQSRTSSPPFALDVTSRPDGQLSQSIVFTQVVDLLTAISSPQPLILVLEDFHWADEESVRLLRYVARHMATDRLFLVATYRSDEVNQEHPLYLVRPLLIREAHGTRVELRRLDTPAIDHLIGDRYRLAVRDQERLITYLQHVGNGNPLYIDELLRALEDADVLRRKADGWSLAPLDTIYLPPLLRQMIDQRLSHLDPVTFDALAKAAIVGQDVPIELWRVLLGVTSDTLASVVEAAQRAHVLEELPNRTGLRFTHALIREAIYERIPLPRRRIWHRHTAEALISAPNPIPDTVASHFQQAGDSRAVEWHVRAGLRARRTAWISAADHFEAAATLIDGDTARGRERGWLLFEAGFLLRFAGIPRSIHILENAEQLALVTNDPVLAAYAHYNRGSQTCIHGNIRQGISEIRQAVLAIDALLLTHSVPATETQAVAVIQQLLPGEDSDQTSLANDQARGSPRVPAVNQQRAILVNWLAHSGHYGEAAEVGTAYMDEMVVAFGDAHLQRAQCVTGHLALGNANAGLGRPDDARREYQHARSGFRSLSDYAMAEHTIWAELLMVHIPYRADRLAEREQLRREATELWERCFGLTIPTLGDGAPTELQLDVLEGRWQASRRLANDHLNATWVAHRHEAIATLAVLDQHQGAHDLAWDRVFQVLPQKSSTEPGGCYFPFGMNTIALAAELALDTGNARDAQRWIELHERWIAWSGGARWHVTNQLLRARHADICRNPARAREFADHSLAHATDPRQPLALIAIHRFLGQLDTTDRHFDDAERHLLESLTMAEACAAPFERALTLLQLAELRLAQRRTDEATTLLDEVQAVCEPLEAKPTLERVSDMRSRIEQMLRKTPSYPAGLSQREVEVLRLVAEGLTDAETADRLFISRRTVTSHLTNIYNKIGMGSRAAAAVWAKEHGVI